MIEPSLIAYYFPEFNEVLYLGGAALHLNPGSDLMTVLQFFTVSPAKRFFI